MNPLDTQIGGDHYKKMPIQPMEYSMANKLDPCQHTIVKYVTRFRDKGGVQDLEKAKHVIDLLIAFENGGYTHQKLAAVMAKLEEGDGYAGADKVSESEGNPLEALFAAALTGGMPKKKSKKQPPTGIELEWVKTCPCDKCAKGRAKYGLDDSVVLPQPRFSAFKMILGHLGPIEEMPMTAFIALREKLRKTESGEMLPIDDLIDMVRKAK